MYRTPPPGRRAPPPRGRGRFHSWLPVPGSQCSPSTGTGSGTSTGTSTGTGAVSCELCQAQRHRVPALKREGVRAMRYGGRSRVCVKVKYGVTFAHPLPYPMLSLPILKHSLKLS